MDERQARLGSVMQELAREKLELIDPYLHSLTMRDAIALLRVGVDVERLARGQAITRAELTVQMLDSLIRELAALFAEVNVIEDPDTRRAVYATKADAIVETYALADKYLTGPPYRKWLAICRTKSRPGLLFGSTLGSASWKK